jgi:hypothetical protein
MPRKPKPDAAKQPMVREATAAYEVTSMAEVSWTAFQSLSQEQQSAFLKKLLDDPEWYEEIADAVAMIETEGEPTRPYREVREELVRESLL